VLADDYSLTHQCTFSPSGGPHNKGTHSNRKFNSDESQSAGKGEDFQRSLRRGMSGGPVSNYCKRRGHVISECCISEKRRSNPTGHSLVQSLLPPPCPSSDDISNYHPFVSEGYVSLTERGDTVAVKILCDTGATQSLIASDVLPLSDQTSVDTSVLIQGVGLEVIRVPLHQIHLQSELILGSVVVGVRPSLPVKGVTLILGNDLAGNKVQSNLQVVNSSPQELHPPPMANGSSDVYPTCVVTRTAARRAQEQEKVYQ